MATLAHLLRRATFGPTAEEVDTATRVGLGATLDTLLNPPGADAGAIRSATPTLPPDPYAGLGRDATRAERQAAQQERRRQTRLITEWWLDRMVTADHQLAEKLVFFWHGHWATSIQKVRSAGLMLRQQETLRRRGLGNLTVLCHVMVRDPALILWLDGHRNTRAAPNENLARELMELFTVGIGAYTEADIKAGARALTGWTVNRTIGTVTMVERRHDPDPKTILGVTARHDTDSFVNLLLRQPACPAFLASRLWFRFGSGTSAAPSAVAAAGLDTRAMLGALLTSAEFAAAAGQLVKQPVEWAVGAMRQLRIRPSTVPAEERRTLLAGLDGLDQVPFRPPSVGGWPSGAAWLNTSSVQFRLRLSEWLATHADREVRDRLSTPRTANRPDALARLLVVDGWTDRTRAVLAEAAGKPERLLALGLASPEYAVH